MINEDKLKTLYCDCECHNPTHFLRFGYWVDTPDVLNIDAVLDNNLNFIQRLYLATVYVFNCRHSWLDSTVGVKTFHNVCGFYDSVWSLQTVNKVIQFLKQFRQEYFEYLGE